MVLYILYTHTDLYPARRSPSPLSIIYLFIFLYVQTHHIRDTNFASAICSGFIDKCYPNLVDDTMNFGLLLNIPTKGVCRKKKQYFLLHEIRKYFCFKFIFSTFFVYAAKFDAIFIFAGIPSPHTYEYDGLYKGSVRVPVSVSDNCSFILLKKKK